MNIKMSLLLKLAALFIAPMLIYPQSLWAQKDCVRLAKRHTTILNYVSASSNVCVSFLSASGTPIFVGLTVKQDSGETDYGLVENKCVTTQGHARFLSAGTNEKAAKACFTETHHSLQTPRKRNKPILR